MNPVAQPRDLPRLRSSFAIWGAAGIGLLGALAVLIWLFATQPWSVRGPYRIGWVNDPPEMFMGRDGQPTGLAVELVREAARRRGISLIWVLSPENSEPALRSGAVDLWPLITITPERLKVLHISAPYLDSVVSFMVRHGSGFQRIEDLSTETVGFVSAKTAEDNPPPINVQLARRYLPEARFVSRKTPGEMIASLCKQEIAAAFIEQNEVIRDLLNGAGYCGSQGFEMITPPGASISLGVGSTMQASAAADAIRDAIDSMSSDGWLAELFSKWGYLSGRSVAYVDVLRASRQRERWTMAAAVLFALLFLLTFWQTVRYFRESTRARRAEAALQQSMVAARRMEERLLENKQRLEEAQQMAGVGSYTTDPLTGRMEWTEELYRIHELDPLRCTPSFDLVLQTAHPDDRAMIQRKTNEVEESNGHVDFEHRLRLPDGRVRFVQVTLTSGIGADGKRWARGTVQDITERRLAEQEKVKLEAQLHQAQKMESIGRLAGGVAHDFNNLLTAINGYSGLLMRKLDSPVRKYAEQIHQAGESAASLTRQLLAFSRMEVMHPVPMHLNEIVLESKKLLERLVGEHIEMRSSLQASPDQVTGDPSQMQQCLMNLVLNARDAMPSGGQLIIETGNAEIGYHNIPADSSGTPGPHVRLTVRDTGIGMDEETRQRIFEPFFTTKKKGHGTGLGLSTVYGIVNQGRGFLAVTSRRGEGSEFSIYLPLDVSCPVPDAPSAEKDAGTSSAFETVLVVDDQEVVREFAAEALRMCGYTVIEARSGAEALEILGDRGTEIQLMITDVLMPGMGGRDLATLANAMCPSTRVLFMTGYDSPGGLGAQAGAEEVIMKPFAAETLEARVREMLHPSAPVV